MNKSITVVIAIAAAAFSSWSSVHAQDISGVWQGVRGIRAMGRTGYELTPEGQRQYEINQAGIAAQDPEIDTALQCLPTGLVRTMVGLPMVISQSDVAVIIVAEADIVPRVIYLDRPHRENYWPTYMGDSIGHWEGDTLVVETINFVGHTFVDMRGLPHSEELRVLERFRRLPDGNLQLMLTVEDPVMFAEPWTMEMTYEPGEFLPAENTCENTRDRPEHENTVVPTSFLE